MLNESLRRDLAAMATDDLEDSVDTKSPLRNKEDQNSSDESQAKQNTKTRRHRASVACTSCRDRRIRCVVPSSKEACVQCERSNTPCVIKDDDERRRPISRTYVYSLVERVALLERLLEDQGLTVPPANHPPETRHRSCRSKGSTFGDDTSLSLFTPQESSVSDDHIASSPCSSDGQIKIEHQTSNFKKRLSVVSDVGNGSGHVNKRMRHDSLVAPTILKVEASTYGSADSATHYNGPHELDQFSTISPPNQGFPWPTAHDHNSGRPIPYSASDSTNIDHSAHGAWSNGAFSFQDYSSHPLNTQYVEAQYAEHRHDAMSIPRRIVTNLDFMPLSTSSWS